MSEEKITGMIYKYIFSDGHEEYREHLSKELKEKLEEEHGKLILKSEV